MRRERTPAWPPCQAWPWRPPETWARQTVQARVLARQPPQVTGRRVTGPRTKPPPSPPPRAPGVVASLAAPPPSSQAWRPWPRVRLSLRVRPWAWPWELAPPWTWVPASASSLVAPWPCPCSRPQRRKSWSRQSQTQSQIRRRRPRTLPSQTPPPTRHWRPPSRSPRHPSRCPSSPSSRRLFAAACSPQRREANLARKGERCGGARSLAWCKTARGDSPVHGRQMPPSEPQSAGAKAEERQEGKPRGYRRRQSQRRQAAKAWLVHLEFTRYADVR